MKFKLTRERLILAGLLSAAGAGLLADQYLFAGENASTNDDIAVPVPPTLGAKTGGAAVAPERLLASRLRELSGPAGKPSEEIRDVFVASGILSGAVNTTSNPIGAWSRRTLNGVIFGADGKGIAIVDGRMVKIGGRFDGMRLVRVTQQMAVFSDGKSQVTLQLIQKNGPPN